MTVSCVECKFWVDSKVLFVPQYLLEEMKFQFEESLEEREFFLFCQTNHVVTVEDDWCGQGVKKSDDQTINS